LIADRRRLTLKCVEALYIRIAKLERDLAIEQQRHREACAREVWVVNEFVKRFPCDATQEILIDRQVNDMDENFSFKKAIGVNTVQSA
jgi:hypothetical protein